jgi:hypothetical protein
VVDPYIVPFDMPDLLENASGKCFCAGLIVLDALLGISSFAVSTLSTDGLFFT